MSEVMQLSAQSQDARTVRGCLTTWSQQQVATGPQNDASVLHLEEQAYTEEDKVDMYYKPDVGYKPDEADPNNEPDIQEEEEEENYDAEYAKIELYCQGTLSSGWCSGKCKIRYGMYMQHEDLQ